MKLLLFALACTIPAGDAHRVEGVVRAAGGSSVVLEHGGVEGVLEAGRTTFVVDPNLGRKLKNDDRVHANVLVTPAGELRLIGVEVDGP